MKVPAMRYILLLFSFSLLLDSCKLMKKEDEPKPKKNNKGMMNRFKPVEWSHNTNIYEVNLRQYTAEGTFNAFAN